jgi:antitoxin component of MazEF toxin-antitoxin module
MVETFNVSLRRWGNSLGAVLPNNIVQKNRLKENDDIKIFIVKESDVLKRNFGKLKGKLKLSGQEMKNILRKELHGIN